MGGFFGNMSNYHSSGYNKFIPEIPKEKFTDIMKAHPDYGKDTSTYRKYFDKLFIEIEKEIYATGRPY